MAGKSKKAIEDSIDSRIVAIEAEIENHRIAITRLDAKLGMARLIRDDLAPSGEDSDE